MAGYRRLRQFQLGRRQCDRARVQPEQQSEIGFPRRGAGDMRDDRQIDRRQQGLTGEVFENPVAHQDLLVALRRDGQAEG
jgi:hypothetical protein